VLTTIAAAADILPARSRAADDLRGGHAARRRLRNGFPRGSG
jgi:hypothetical protein